MLNDHLYILRRTFPANFPPSKGVCLTSYFSQRRKGLPSCLSTSWPEIFFSNAVNKVCNCFDFVALFAQLWLNVFCLRSQNELKNFHSALQLQTSQWSNVNLWWEFSLTYNGLNDTLISLNGLYFIFYLPKLTHAWKAVTRSRRILSTSKLYKQTRGVRKPSFLGIL